MGIASALVQRQLPAMPGYPRLPSRSWVVGTAWRINGIFAPRLQSSPLLRGNWLVPLVLMQRKWEGLPLPGRLSEGVLIELVSFFFFFFFFFSFFFSTLILVYVPLFFPLSYYHYYRRLAVTCCLEVDLY